MTNPSTVGAVAERELACALLRVGWSVFAPLFDAHGRIDLVIMDPSGTVLRTQVKTSRLVRDGTVLCFRTCSNTANRPVGYGEEIDVFGVWSPDLEQAFVVPIAVTPTRLCHLRLAPPANGQRSGIRYAVDFAVTRRGFSNRG